MSEQSKPIKVYYPLFAEGAWQGGTNYFNNLKSVSERFLPHIKMEGVRLFSIPDKTPPTGIGARLSKLVSPEKFQQNLKQDSSEYLQSLSDAVPFCLFTVFPQHLTGKIRFPRFFWIPDFQVYYLPQLFTAEDIEQRKSTYKNGSAITDIVVLSSESAKADFVKFFPEHEAKARILRFVTEIPTEIYAKPSVAICAKHNLPEKYFYVPNQFWKHKNHKTVLHAVKKLKEEGVEMNVVFSGSTTDTRNPEYIKEILHLVTDSGLDKQIFILGMIPHEDVYQLIRQSVCVINPSFFEGWSTTVEEVKSIGKKIILSNIPVHIEQAPPGGIYFPPDDATQLAMAMKKVWQENNAGSDAEMEIAAKKMMPQRIEKFANTFKQMLDDGFALLSARGNS